MDIGMGGMGGMDGMDGMDGMGDFDDTPVDYSTYVRKIMRFETKGLLRLSKGQHKELKGEYCFIEEYNAEKQYFKVYLLGNLEEIELTLPEAIITRVEYGKLPAEAKELSKLYRTSYNKYESTRRYLSRTYTKLTELTHELGRLLQEVHKIGVSTFSDTLERASRTQQMGATDFQPQSVQSPINRMNNSPGQSSFGGPSGSKSFFGGDTPSNSSFNSFGGSSSALGSSSQPNTYGSQQSPQVAPYVPVSERKDKEGFQNYSKNLLGNERLVKQRNKRGKLMKKAKVVLKPNHIYYVKLTQGAVLMIFVKSEEYEPKKYRRLYYSEFGMVEPREIFSFIEKEDNEPGTAKLKELYQRVFSLEKSISRYELKKKEKDEELASWVVKRDGYRSILNQYILKGIRSKEVSKCGRKEFDFAIAKEGKVRLFTLKNIEPKVFAFMYKKYHGFLPTMRYIKEHNTVVIPLVIGVRRLELKKMVKELIGVYGHKDSKEMYDLLKEMSDRI